MHGRTEQLSLAWQGGPQAAAQSSYEAAVSAEAHAEYQRDRLRALYRERGYYGVTDAEAERALNLGPQSITARRNELVQAGEVVVRWPESRRASVKTPKLRVTVWVSVLSIR